MFQRSFFAVCGLGLAFAGCTMPVESEGVHPDDMKPEDGSELAGAEVGSSQQAHALHYTDGTNLWMEKNYPMGTDNPNCKDWWVYDRYLSNRPAIGSTKFTTYETSHAWAQGATIDQMMAAIPNSLGYSDVWKAILKDHNSVVARTNGKCSGRYVFQFDNRTNYGPFERTSYWVSANIPSYLIPPNKAACTATAGESVPATMMDMYVCEAKKSGDVPSISSWCGTGSKNWRKVGSFTSNGYWTESLKSCFSGGGVYYQAPADRVAVSFNVVIKAGIGHGVAPAEIYVLRYATP